MTDSTCPRCHGSGWMTSATLDPRRKLPHFANHPPDFERCSCRAEARRRQQLTRAGIPPEYQRCTFDTYRAYTDTLAAALRIARTYADRYPVQPAHTDPPGLLFIGQAGVGKTHLAAALLMHVMAHTGCRGLFWKTRDLLRAMRNSYNPAIQTTERHILDPLLACDLLVLDDLGAERLTDWVADTIDHIIDTRYSAGRPVVITTNFPDVDDEKDLNGLWCRVGFRTRSRLHAMCRPVTLDGADYRDLSPDATERDLKRHAAGRVYVPPTRDLRRGPKPPGARDGKADLGWSGGRGGNR